jgi:hypothetical protein
MIIDRPVRAEAYRDGLASDASLGTATFTKIKS